jgi:diguanylate cyclase (GGDEF)-like protein
VPWLTQASAIVVWSSICFILGALFWGVALSYLNDGGSAFQSEKALDAVSSHSNAYDGQLARVREQIDWTTRTLNYDWDPSHAPLGLERLAPQRRFPAFAILYEQIPAATSSIMNSSFDRYNKPDIERMAFFLSHKTDVLKDVLIIPSPVILGSGKRVIRSVDPLDAPDGRFSGLVPLSAESPYRASIHHESPLHKSVFLPLTDKGRMLVASTLGEWDRSQPTSESSNEVVPIPEESLVETLSRIMPWQSLTDYPLVSFARRSDQEVFASHAAMHSYRNIAFAAGMFLLLFVLATTSLFYRGAWKRQQADNIKHIYRLAIEGTQEGFYMARAIYDQNERVVDFLIEDCNERGAAFVGRTKIKLVGSKLTDLYSEELAQNTLLIFCRALETGFYEDEFRVPFPSSPKTIWMQRRLVRSGNELIMIVRDISDLKAHEQALWNIANLDALTTLYNRHWLMNYLPIAIEQARKSNKNLALLFLDLNGFKKINDTLGHAAGDELLRAVGALLKTITRPQDNVARLGGDEFVVILQEINGNDEVSVIAERVVETLSAPIMLADQIGRPVHTAIGISVFPQDGDNTNALLEHADVAMYAAKGNSKTYYQFFHPHLSEHLRERRNKEKALREAVESEAFMLHYQPRVSTFTGELRGMDVLVHWLDPERGWISPQEFIPMAEDSGLISQLGKLVIKKACSQLAQWKEQNLSLVPLSINVSIKQFHHSTLSMFFAYCITHYDIAPSLIELKIKELSVRRSDDAIDDELASIERLGIKVLVGDFGAGYSSWVQLQRLDFDVARADRGFTAHLGNGKKGETFFRASLSMAKVLGMKVIAEGVETEEQLRFLQSISCDEAQGAFISAPVLPSEMARMMQERFLFPGVNALPHAG